MISFSEHQCLLALVTFVQKLEVKKKCSQPILVSLVAHSLSVATLVAVSDGVDIWVTLRFSYH